MTTEATVQSAENKTVAANDSNYALTCCSTADLRKQHFEDRNIEYLCFRFFLDGTEYSDDLGESIPFQDFYKAMVDGADTKTSQPNAENFVDFWTPILESGKDIVHVTLSSGLSGAINSASVAKEMLSHKFPTRKIYVVDSLGASSGYGLLMDKLADLRDQGFTAEQTAEWAEEHKLNAHHWFFSTDLTFYVKGGRVSKASGFVGGLLNICPLLNMDDAGHLIPREKIRSKKRVIKEIVERMKEHADGGTEYNGKCYISQSDCIDDAREVATMIEEAFPNLDGPVEINWVGTTIGSHTGPGTVALFFWGDTRTA